MLPSSRSLDAIRVVGAHLETHDTPLSWEEERALAPTRAARWRAARAGESSPDWQVRSTLVEHIVLREHSAPRSTVSNDGLARVERELQDVRRRLAKLEAVVEPAMPVASDPFIEWGESHRGDLAKYPDSHVAISLERGVVAAAKSDEEFMRQLALIDAPTRAELLLTHTSLFR